MFRYLLILTLSVIALAAVSTADAATKTSGNRTEYHERFGTKFEHGFYYRGREHRHWDSRYFDDRYGCYFYHCPSTREYYYWCGRDDRFYLVSYCPYETYVCGEEFVCKSCPVECPTRRPECPCKPVCKDGGLNITIHPIKGTPAPSRPILENRPVNIVKFPEAGEPTRKPTPGKVVVASGKRK